MVNHGGRLYPFGLCMFFFLAFMAWDQLDQVPIGEAGDFNGQADF